MIDELAKQRLHDRLRTLRQAVLWKLEGLDEYDLRRPMTASGTNLLGLVKHLSVSEALYFGDVFGRHFDGMPARWFDADTALLPSTWATEDEALDEIVGRYRAVWEHADATIADLAIDAPGHVFWWPRPDVTLLDVLVHLVAETGRHAGHADILREQIDGSVGADAESLAAGPAFDAAFWARHRDEVEQAAKAAAGRR